MNGAAVLEMARTFDGTKLKQLREARGVSKETLAGAAGCSVPTITNIETGKHEPKGGLLGRLADALGLRHVDDFYRVTK